MERRRQPLRRARVREPVHPDLAVRLRQPGRPLDRVVAVGRLAAERVPHAVGLVLPADVLLDHDEAAHAICLGASVVAAQGPVLVVGDALQDDGERAGLVGREYVRPQDGAVPHLRLDVHLRRDRAVADRHRLRGPATPLREEQAPGRPDERGEECRAHDEHETTTAHDDSFDVRAHAATCACRRGGTAGWTRPAHPARPRSPSHARISPAPV